MYVYDSLLTKNGRPSAKRETEAWYRSYEEDCQQEIAGMSEDDIVRFCCAVLFLHWKTWEMLPEIAFREPMTAVGLGMAEDTVPRVPRIALTELRTTFAKQFAEIDAVEKPA